MSSLTLLEQLTDCLRNAVVLMREENLGCDCGDANDPPCVFCTAQHLLWRADAENARQRHALEARHGGLHALVEAAKDVPNEFCGRCKQWVGSIHTCDPVIAPDDSFYRERHR